MKEQTPSAAIKPRIKQKNRIMETKTEQTFTKKALDAAFALCAYVEHNKCESHVTKEAAAAFLDACAESEHGIEFKTHYQNRASNIRNSH